MSVRAWWNISNWYLKMQGMMYIIFFVINRCINNRKVACWILGVVVFLMCIIFCIFQVGGRSYYISEMSFVFGVILYEYGSCIKKWFDGHMKFVVLVTCALCVLAMVAFIVDDYTVADCIFHNLLCISFCFMMLILLYYFKIGNSILAFFNNISLELYLCQFALFNLYKAIFRSLQQNINFEYVLFVLVSDIFVSLIAVKLNRRISQKINKVIGN